MTDATFALRPKVRSHLYLVSLHDDSLTPARARKERERGEGAANPLSLDQSGFGSEITQEGTTFFAVNLNSGF